MKELCINLKFYEEPSKRIPIAIETDVLVLGGGPAGFSAAVNAARMGVATVLVEQCGTVGGVATSGLMSHWAGHVSSDFYEEVLDKSFDCEKRNVINPEKLKIVLLKMIEESGVKLRLYTLAVAPIMADNNLIGVIVESKTGREAIMAKVIVDATGDGDIAARAGVPFIKGRENDNKMQPMTVMFKVAGVDYDKAVFPGSFETNTEIPKGKIQDLGKSQIPHPAGHVLLYKTSLPGVVTCNMTNCIDVDGTNADDLTTAEICCRSQMEHIVEFLRETVPGYENCYIVSSASSIGVRETRHFIGDYILNEQDISEARIFDDWAVRDAYFNFDVHSISGPGLDKTGVQHEFKQTKGYTIPYRCLLPQKVGNLLLAGRNISGTHMAHSNFRVMPICVGTGHAAGIAAALCVSHGVTPHGVDIRELQKMLTS